MSLKWGLGHVGLETWPGEDPQTDGAGPIREARGPTQPVPPGVPEKASETLSLYGTQHPAGPWDAGDPWHAPEVEREWGAR